jgi:ParB family transcriptional regulator, chromosome partitioning protein
MTQAQAHTPTSSKRRAPSAPAAGARSKIKPAQAAAPASRVVVGAFVQVRLDRLAISPRNVRRVAPDGIEELAALIDSQGLLQPLVVTRNDGDPERYDVEAGGRRFRALQRLAQAGRIAPDAPVECRLIEAERALEASLAENSARQAMHPADQSEAFRALLDSGLPVERIAERFGITVRAVQQRLRLANVAPDLVERFRAGELTLDQMQALALTDDHARQIAIMSALPAWHRDAWAIKQRIVEHEVHAGDPRALFVGVADYEAAGGVVRRDLFSERGDVYLSDAALLDLLVTQRLEREAETLRAEGWSWVEARARFDYAERSAFRVLPRVRRPKTEAEQSRIAALRARLNELDAALADTDDEAVAEGLETQRDEAEEALDAAEADEPEEWSADDRARAGAVVSMQHGELAVVCGLVRPNDEGGISSEARAYQDKAQRTDTQAQAGLSTRLAQSLAAHRTAAMAATMLEVPRVALVFLAWRLTDELVGRSGTDSSLIQIRTTDAMHDLVRQAPDLEASSAGQALAGARAQWTSELPQEPAARLRWLADLPDAKLVELLAWCTACTLDTGSAAVSARARGTDLLAEWVGLDAARWWRPSAEHFFGLMTKAQIAQAVGEALGSEAAATIANMKKDAATKHAEQLVAPTRWVPATLRR